MPSCPFETSSIQFLELSAAPCPTPAWTAQLPNRVGAGERVLIVEDDEQILRAAMLRLESAGYCPLIARDGYEAAQQVTDAPPQAMVLDLCIPRLDGIQLLELMRASGAIDSIPVVVLSASMRDRRRALQAGARFFLGKPYNGRTLIEAVARSIADSAAARRTSSRAANSADETEF